MPGAGGFSPSDWHAAGLALLGLLTVAVIGVRRILPHERAPRLALAAFAAWVALNFASLAWAAAPGRSWEAANLLLTTLLAGWVVALVPWRPGSADVFLGLFSVGAAAVCAITLVSALGADDLTSRFTDARFNQPLDYPNAAAAFGFMAAIPALVASARPELPIWLRGVAQGLATFLGAFALLPQSRGSVVGVAVTLVVLMLVAPYRWRMAVRIALALGAVVVVSGPIFDVYNAASDTGLVSPVLDRAARAIALAALASAWAGVLVAVVERAVPMDERRRRLARLAGIAAVVAGLLAVAGVAAANADRISDAARDEWNAMTHPGPTIGTEPALTAAPETDAERRSRLVNADPLQRYDYWRVSLDAFRDEPLLGVGAGGFETRYQLERRYEKVSKYPHNLVLRVLGENGLAGALLLLAFGVAAAVGVLRGFRGAPPAERGMLAVAIGMATYFFAHGSFDWLEPYPVLAGPALAAVLIALVVRARAAGGPVQGDGQGRTRRSVSVPSPVLAAAGAVALLAAAWSLAVPWLSIRYQQRAAQTWRTDPGAAYRDLDRAASIDPLSVGPLVAEGIIAVLRGEHARARTAFEEALGREDNWIAHYELAAIAAGAGDRRAALRQLDLAERLNPKDRVITAAREDIRSNPRIDPREITGRLFESPLFISRRLS